MPHMAPFVWMLAPVLVGSVIYGLIICTPHPIIFSGPTLPKVPSNIWSWK